ncbi:MAG: amidophosphoribosyltransferase [Verrucomicrobia bacterium]|nr:MAG: amidophosphoribosyltransferase [Verrucomicrobiota bacterium]
MVVPIKILLQSALDLLYPPHCESCQKPGRLLCRNCVRQLRRIRSPYCQVCSLPVSGRSSQKLICADCRLRNFHFQFAICGYEANDVMRRLIHRFKYHGISRLELLLSQLIFHAWRDRRATLQPPEILVPVPLHSRRERERGFNQSARLAKALSRRTGIPYGTLLKKSVFTESQTLLNRRQRRQNLRGAFTLRQNSLLTGLSVMLVDDVLTTGSTLEECSKTLLAGGARAVSAITLARA